MTSRRTRPRDADTTIVSIAARQHGVVTAAQLLQAGLSRYAVARRVHAGRIRPLHRGVYVAGPLTVPLAMPMGAVLSCGRRAVVGHRSAAVLWQIMAPDTAAAPVDVIVPPADRRSRPGVRVHRCALERDESTRVEGIPVTTPARTLYDLAGALAGRDLERIVAEALSRGLTTASKINALVKRYEHRPAARRLAAFTAPGSPPALTRSTAEESFLALITRSQLPRPEVNVRVHGHEVDFYWRTARLVVEMDGFAFHGSRSRFESDRRRDAMLAAAGLRVVRVTWRQLEHEREALLVRLAQALVQRP